jgi:predicted nucleotidyltransferase
MSETDVPLSREISRELLVLELRALRPVLERRAVTGMTLFGSRARRDNRRDSDIDVAIEVDEARKFSLLDLVGVEHAIEDRIGLKANVQMRRSLSPAFRNELQRDGVEIF